MRILSGSGVEYRNSLMNAELPVLASENTKAGDDCIYCYLNPKYGADFIIHWPYQQAMTTGYTNLFRSRGLELGSIRP